MKRYMVIVSSMAIVSTMVNFYQCDIILENNFMKTTKAIVFILNKIRHVDFTVFFRLVKNNLCKIIMLMDRLIGLVVSISDY